MQNSVIIFGSTGAIGSSIALQLKKEGYKLILHGNKNSLAWYFLLDQFFQKN